MTICRESRAGLPIWTARVSGVSPRRGGVALVEPPRAHVIDEAEAHEVIVDLSARLVKKVYRL